MTRKILFISDHGDPLIPLGSSQAGGQNNYVKHLALSLDALGFEVHVATHWSNEAAQEIEHFGERSIVYRFTGGEKGFVPKDEMFELLPTFYRQMCATLAIEEYEVVHTHYWLSGVLALMLQQQHSIYWVHTNHSLAIAKAKGTGERNIQREHFEKTIMEKADVVLATTPNEKELITQFTKGKSDVSVVPIGVAPTFLTPSSSTMSLPSSYYLYVGRLEESKGIYDLFEAFRELTAEDDEIQLLIAGGCEKTVNLTTYQPITKKLQRAIRGIEHRVVFLGPQNEQQLKELYSAALATVMPSHYESFGMVAAEAQACGCPVIATSVGGLQDIVQKGRTGLHTPKESAKKLAARMRQLLANRHYVAFMGRQARNFAQREFNWKRIAKQVQQLYKGARYVSTIK
ncbi:glycosyltransferase [Caryophanon tenue]|uniref:Glycosyl transferase n=1 Tax=Caryophanon tenue TaxID=33978 RepID=A0A1C0YHX3_9BACL|nr:glycosyltransferase [Caryophanon tenue]OCS86788.1 glycosyl transferase [Caryophanon tenue]